MTDRRSRRSRSRATFQAITEALEPRQMLASWTTLGNLAPSVIGTMELLTDGTVIGSGNAGGSSNGKWYKLTPAANGDYAAGTWTTLATEPVSRLYTATNVLQDGRVINVGGEYVNGGAASWNNTGDIYDPVANTWTSIPNFPQTQFGDDPSMLMDNGLVLFGYLSGAQTYFFNPTASTINGIAPNTWSVGPTKLNNDRSDEETWVKTIQNTTLSYNIFGSPQSAQKYNPSTNTWTAAGTATASLATSAGAELGPALSIPDGRIVQIGGNSNNSMYNPSTNTWSALPTTPGGIGGNDAPGALLPNGHVLYAAGDISTSFNAPTTFFDMDPVAGTLTAITAPGGGATLAVQPFTTRMLTLPTGQILFARNSTQLYIYNGDGTPAAASKPVISGITGTGTFTLTGSKLNGISSGASYGDDAEMDSNYPIVQLTATNGNVYYAKSKNWNAAGIGAFGATSVQFTLPAGIPNGSYQLRVSGAGVLSDPTTFSVGSVVANGIWTGLADGTTWTNAGNWSNNTLPGATDNVVISVAGLQTIVLSSGTQTVLSVTSDENLTVNGGTLAVTNASTVNGSFTLSGGTYSSASTLTLNNAVNSWSSGSFTGAGSNIIPSGAALNVTGGGLKNSLRPFSVNGTVNVTANSNTNVRVAALTIAGTGKVDLFNNDLIVTGTAKATISNYIKTAYNFGTWTGTTGIFSTTAKNNPNGNTMLGLLSGTEYFNNNGAGTFDTATVAASDVLVKYTWFGDVDFNGAVDSTDYNIIDFGFLTGASGWANGDVDYSGAVDSSDYNNIDFAFVSQSGVL